jgi:hypothetical protein
LPAVLASPGRAAIFAMRQWLLGQFRPAPATKDSASSRRLLGRGRNGISQDNLFEFVAHGVRAIPSFYRGPDPMHVVVVFKRLEKFAGVDALLVV